MKFNSLSLVVVLIASCIPFFSIAQSSPTPVVSGVVTGSDVVSVGTTARLADVNTGGLWSSDNNTVASVSADGTVTGVTTGSAVISYSYINSYFELVIDIVNVKVDAVAASSDNNTLCGGIATILNNAVMEIWSNVSAFSAVKANIVNPAFSYSPKTNCNLIRQAIFRQHNNFALVAR